MKNSQRGFIVPLLTVVIAILVIGGGVYVYENKKLEQIEPEPIINRYPPKEVSTSSTTPIATTNKKADTPPSVKKTTNTSPNISTNKPALSMAEFNQNSLKNIFQTFGGVTFQNGEYVIKEERDAGIFSTVSIPPDGAVLIFNYKFLTEGDGDVLSVNKRNTADPNSSQFSSSIYVGENLAMARSGYIEGTAEIYSGGNLELVFTLFSRGNVNAILSIKDIKIMTYTEYENFLNKKYPSHL